MAEWKSEYGETFNSNDPADIQGFADGTFAAETMAKLAAESLAMRIEEFGDLDVLTLKQNIDAERFARIVLGRKIAALEYLCGLLVAKVKDLNERPSGDHRDSDGDEWKHGKKDHD